jgi:hypothetical protein
MKKRKKTEYDRPAEWMPRAGDYVDYHPIIGEPATTYMHKVKEVWIANTGYPVANIIGVRGWVSVDALTPTNGGWVSRDALAPLEEDKTDQMIADFSPDVIDRIVISSIEIVFHKMVDALMKHIKDNKDFYMPSDNDQDEPVLSPITEEEHLKIQGSN